jgi:integrase
MRCATAQSRKAGKDDAAYNGVHLHLAESNPYTRREWIAALDKIEALNPSAVIAGHKRAENDDSPRIIEETRQYIRDFYLKTFRSTYATRMLRQGFDVRTVQDWMGHKSLETTMRYLVPATDVHDRLDEIEIPESQNRRFPKKRRAVNTY